MPSPGQGGDVTLIRTGAHKVTIDPNGTPKTAGFTKGNLQLTFSVNKRPVTVAEYGTTPVDEEVTGVTLTVRFSMIERSLKVLDIALNGLYPGNYLSATTNRGIGRSGIQRAQTRGKTILLHPLSQGSSTAEDITLQQVMLTPTGNIEYSDQGDQVIEVEGTCVVSPSAADGSLLAIINEANAGA
jgi:hypothetical protein